MLPRWIASVKGYVISNKFIVPGKAREIDALIPVWIITEKEGSIISAHCVDSKASLGETFFHTASVLLFVRVDENSPKSKNWRALRLFARDLNLPSFCILKRTIEYARARNINFKLASKLKSELDTTTDILVNAYHKSPK